jgi:hypothetical protein
VSKDFNTDLISFRVAKGIEGAFNKRLDMTGKLLRTAPNCFVAVKG